MIFDDIKISGAIDVYQAHCRAELYQILKPQRQNTGYAVRMNLPESLNP
jgi:hypothetical protein